MSESSQRIEFYASAVPGSERVVRDELSDLGFRGPRLNRGGIPFWGEPADGWRACLQCRTAQRIMRVLARFDAATPEALYAGVRAIDWSWCITARQTLSVSAYVHGSSITHSGFAALRVKDAIVDQIRDREGNRPDVARDDADVRIFLYLARNRATVYLDLSGRPLFQRGYRSTGGTAPLKETLAAIILRLAEWDGETALLDPMCGSGTLLIEAALWAGNVAPGLLGRTYGFQRWADFDTTAAEKLEEMKNALRLKAHRQHPRITGTDIDAEMVTLAKANARRAGFRLGFRQADVRDLRPDGPPRFLVTNPPYGRRLDADKSFFQQLGATVSRLSGWRIAIFTGVPDFDVYVPIKPRARYALRNGDLPCELYVYEIPS